MKDKIKSSISDISIIRGKIARYIAISFVFISLIATSAMADIACSGTTPDMSSGCQADRSATNEPGQAAAPSAKPPSGKCGDGICD